MKSSTVWYIKVSSSMGDIKPILSPPSHWCTSYPKCLLFCTVCNKMSVTTEATYHIQVWWHKIPCWHMWMSHTIRSISHLPFISTHKWPFFIIFKFLILSSYYVSRLKENWLREQIHCKLWKGLVWFWTTLASTSNHRMG